jgi:hypothetical protein
MLRLETEQQFKTDRCRSSTNKFSSILSIVFRQGIAKVQKFWTKILKKKKGGEEYVSKQCNL